MNHLLTASLLRPGLCLLLLTGVLEWDDILKAKSAWDTLMWFAALVMMATFLGNLGVVKWFSTSMQGGIGSAGRRKQGGLGVVVELGVGKQVDD